MNHNISGSIHNWLSPEITGKMDTDGGKDGLGLFDAIFNI